MLVSNDPSGQLAILLGNIALIATFGMSLLFVITYATMVWWKHESGRNVMALMAAITLVTGLYVVRLEFHDTLWFLWLRVLVFMSVPIIIAWRLWILIRAQWLRPYSPPLRKDHDAADRYDDERDPLDQS